MISACEERSGTDDGVSTKAAEDSSLQHQGLPGTWNEGEDRPAAHGIVSSGGRQQSCHSFWREVISGVALARDV